VRHTNGCVADTIKEFGGIAIKFFIKSNLVESRSAKADFIGDTVKSFCSLGINGSFILMRVENNFA
jgi:hypothetical protein